MKILLLGSKEYPFGISHKYDKKAGGGIEAHVEKLAKYLGKAGHDVFIITRKFPGQRGFEKHGKITIYRTRYIKNNLLRTFSFNLSSFMIARKIIKNGIDIIHCHGPTAGFFGALLTGFTGKPMVFTPHGTISGWHFPLKQILQFFERLSALSSRKNIFVSKTAYEELCREKDSLLTNAVDIKDYGSQKRTWKETRFLFFGRLEEVKGIHSLIEAFQKLIDKKPDTKLLIIGEGTLKNYIQNIIQKNNLNRNIQLLGWSKPSDALQKTDVFVLPSSEKGQPIALLEAMASGKIIITSLRYIKHNKTGLSVKAGNIEDLYKKMLYVHDHLRPCRKLGIAAKKEARDKYAWNALIKRIEDVYSDVLAC